MTESILEKLKQQTINKKAGFLCAVGGVRMAGKTTISGTLKGKTLLIQIKSLEAGNTSAIQLAAESDNELVSVEVESSRDLFALLNSEDILAFDNIYIDGLSAFTELLYVSKEFAIIEKKPAKDGGGMWKAFDMIKDRSTQLILKAKELAETHNKNVFVTYALQRKNSEDGAVMEMVSKGQASKDLIEGKCPNVVVIASKQTEEGTVRKIITSNFGLYAARLGNLLDRQNPGVVEADLNALIKIAKGETK